MVGPLNLRERLNKLSTAETIQKWHAARGVRMCIDIQLSCHLALSQARKALPFETACEAYAVKKKLSSFHAWFTLRQTFVFIKNKNMVCYICDYKYRFTEVFLKAFAWDRYVNAYVYACVCVNWFLRVGERVFLSVCSYLKIKCS